MWICLFKNETKKGEGKFPVKALYDKKKFAFFNFVDIAMKLDGFSHIFLLRCAPLIFVLCFQGTSNEKVFKKNSPFLEKMIKSNVLWQIFFSIRCQSPIHGALSTIYSRWITNKSDSFVKQIQSTYSVSLRNRRQCQRFKFRSIAILQI